jgi:hypothetical protein
LSAPVIISVISLVVAVAALTINASGLIRRPKIVAEWGWVEEADEHGPDVEGLTIIATARRRPIEVDELGIVLLPKRTWRRRLPEWRHQELPFRVRVGPAVSRGQPLPIRLEDGASIRGFMHPDFAVDEFYGETGVSYVYVLGSGTVHLTRDSRVLRKLRSRRRLGED